jgi:acyl-CoA dehydrogenase
VPLAGLEPISAAYGLNHYTLDLPYRRLLRAHLGEEPDLAALGEYVGGDVYEVAYRVDLLSQPLLANWDYRGDNPDVVILDPAERRVLLDLVGRFGVNRHPFEGRSWHHHYAGIYLIGDPGLSCILTITIQTAYALYKYAPAEIRDLYTQLAGIREPYLWGATWFTEAQGGSDLGANETLAEPSGGLWRLTGYKYFSSGAGLADVALATARPPGARPGAKGLALFAVPRLDSEGRLNYRVRRLKWKSGTVAVPTGEVEFLGSEAYLLGEADKGIYYTLEDLMVSRLANSIGALGIARKAYLEAYGFASTRRAFGRRIIEHPLLARDLLESELLIEAGLAMTLKAISLFDEAWHDTPPYTPRYHYARLMTHIAKNYTADIAAQVTRTAMEVFGGIGFLHEFAVERWHREALITPIWEGTSNIQALDMLEAMVKKSAHEGLLAEAEALATSQQDTRTAEAALEALTSTLTWLQEDPGMAEWRAKRALTRLADASAVLLLLDASRRAGEPLLEEAARLYYEWRISGELPKPDPEIVRGITSLHGALEEVDWQSRPRL